MLVLAFAHIRCWKRSHSQPAQSLHYKNIFSDHELLIEELHVFYSHGYMEDIRGKILIVHVTDAWNSHAITCSLVTINFQALVHR